MQRSKSAREREKERKRERKREREGGREGCRQAGRERVCMDKCRSRLESEGGKEREREREDERERGLTLIRAAADGGPPFFRLRDNTDAESLVGLGEQAARRYSRNSLQHCLNLHAAHVSKEVAIPGTALSISSTHIRQHTSAYVSTRQQHVAMPGIDLSISSTCRERGCISSVVREV
jgi:hypothetical protein